MYGAMSEIAYPEQFLSGNGHRIETGGRNEENVKVLTVKICTARRMRMQSSRWRSEVKNGSETGRQTA